MIEPLLRKQIAFRYLTGDGIEIGALHSPLEIPPGVKVRYLDRMPRNQLRQQYPELSQYELVELDIIDDGETLVSVSDISVDFVIANHMIEHCQNPILSIKNWLRVLKPGGVLYMAVPDKRCTFDCDRPVTPLEHLIRDYTEGPEWSMCPHFEEWARLVDKVSENDVAAHAKFLAEINYSIHFHVWTQVEFLELLLYCQSNLYFPIEIELLQKNNIEFIVVLSKTA
jgi:SAM-dependent methyltransferase